MRKKVKNVQQFIKNILQAIKNPQILNFNLVKLCRQNYVTDNDSMLT